METENNLITKTFLWMFLGLLTTAVTSYLTYSTGLLETILTRGSFGMILILEMIVVIIFSFLSKRLPAMAVAILFFLYAAISGITFSSIFYEFKLNSIILLSMVSALLFGGFAFYGYKTKKDLSKYGGILFITLLGCIVESIINSIVGNSLIDIILGWIVLFIFFGLTVYDTNKIKGGFYEYYDADKAHIYAAMDLYLDFINIFIRILSLFGDRKK